MFSQIPLPLALHLKVTLTLTLTLTLTFFEKRKGHVRAWLCALVTMGRDILSYFLFLCCVLFYSHGVYLTYPAYYCKYNCDYLQV